ncbi:hypothetical protein HAX54_020914 [Datura stramonium]|uniref:Uncharacterized protein n=1 Tax=Datura stramonium TaxID=4076 RepID=A0ABS8S6D9_DATST|nr:hypothetical protein [Datura stramonium]
MKVGSQPWTPKKIETGGCFPANNGGKNGGQAKLEKAMDGSFLTRCSLTGAAALAGEERGETRRGKERKRALWWSTGEGGETGSDGIWFVLIGEERGEAATAVRLWWFHRRGERKREVGWSCKKNEKSRVWGMRKV